MFEPTHIVYNNFPFPTDPSAEARQAVEAATQAVLDVRARLLSPSPTGPGRGGATLAHLYGPDKIPADLLGNHQALDRAVGGCHEIKRGIRERLVSGMVVWAVE